MKQSIPGLPHLEINTIFCIGRNYALHAKELNNPVPDEPIIFLKPNSSVITDGGTIHIPEHVSDVHHEVEMVIAIGKRGKNIPEKNVEDYIAGYGIGIDLTARTLQQKAKESGKPWAVSKGFDTFAPIGNFEKFTGLGPLLEMDLELRINKESRQKGNTRDMLFPIPALIHYLSRIFTLLPGDLIFTGTPEGVGPINHGDEIKALLDSGRQILNVYVD